MRRPPSLKPPTDLDDRAGTLRGRRGIIDGEPLRGHRNRYRCEDGTYRWFEWQSVGSADRQLVYAIARDVTADIEAERALSDATESLTTLLDSIADGVVATDARGAVTRLNPVAETLTGWSSAEAAGRPLGEIVDIVTRTGTDIGDGGRTPVTHDVDEPASSDPAQPTVLVARGGGVLPVTFSRSPMRDAEGVVTGAVVVLRDRTCERRAQENEERLQRQLMLADRMASVGTLAAGVAHEINNPLTYVSANLEALTDALRELRDVSVPSAHRDEWTQIAAEARQGADRIRDIVRSLMTFSRDDAERSDAVDVAPVIELAIKIAQNEIRHRARLVKELGSTPLVAADDARLGQVILNLLVNAAQAIGDGNGGGESSEIRIVTFTDAAGHAVIEVLDTGPGIPTAVMPRIFDPFFTTKRVGIGTGLGLSICHTIVTRIGGKITARNREGRGAAFRVTLPAAAHQEPARSPSLRPATLRPPTDGARRAKVLIVDDDRAVGEALRRSLDATLDVMVVSSAKDALDAVLGGAPFDVILSDLMMPGMSGMELYEALTRERPRAAERVVFLTGGAFTTTARAFLELVPNERLAKPCDAATLRDVVARYASGGSR